MELLVPYVNVFRSMTKSGFEPATFRTRSERSTSELLGLLRMHLNVNQTLKVDQGP